MALCRVENVKELAEMAPDQVILDQITLDQITLDQIILEQIVPDQIVPDQIVPDQVIPVWQIYCQMPSWQKYSALAIQTRALLRRRGQ
jgi:hypothetical protein